MAPCTLSAGLEKESKEQDSVKPATGLGWVQASIHAHTKWNQVPTYAPLKYWIGTSKKKELRKGFR